MDLSRPKLKVLEPGEVRRLGAGYFHEDALPLSTVESQQNRLDVEGVKITKDDKLQLVALPELLSLCHIKKDICMSLSEENSFSEDNIKTT